MNVSPSLYNNPEKRLGDETLEESGRMDGKFYSMCIYILDNIVIWLALRGQNDHIYPAENSVELR